MAGPARQTDPRHGARDRARNRRGRSPGRIRPVRPCRRGEVPRMNALLRMLDAKRLYVLFAFHVVIFGVVYRAAYELRYEFDVPPEKARVFWGTLPLLLIVKLATFAVCGTYHGWWRYVTISDLTCLLRSATAATLLFSVCDRIWAALTGAWTTPISVLLLDWLLGIIVLGGLRSAYRL